MIMTLEEARLELDASTLRSQDASEEALALSSEHPEISQWLDQRKTRDEIIAAAFADFPVPEGLRERLLKIQDHPATATTTNRHKALLGTVLVGLALVAVAMLTLFDGPNEDMPEWQKDSMDMVVKADSGDILFDHESPDFKELRSKLISSASPAPQELPKGLALKELMGCKTFACADRKASLLCFVMEPGSEAHLVTLSNKGLKDMPPQHNPQFVAHGEWNVAMWSDGDQSFMLATKSAKSTLKGLFANTSKPKRIPFIS
jgi:hypothetical protein